MLSPVVWGGCRKNKLQGTRKVHDETTCCQMFDQVFDQIVVFITGCWVDFCPEICRAVLRGQRSTLLMSTEPVSSKNKCKKHSNQDKNKLVAKLKLALHSQLKQLHVGRSKDYWATFSGMFWPGFLPDMSWPENTLLLLLLQVEVRMGAHRGTPPLYSTPRTEKTHYLLFEIQQSKTWFLMLLTHVSNVYLTTRVYQAEASTFGWNDNPAIEQNQHLVGLFAFPFFRQRRQGVFRRCLTCLSNSFR